MSAWLIGIVTLIYVAVAINFMAESRVGMGFAFLGYAIANLGLILDAITKGQ